MINRRTLVPIAVAIFAGGLLVGLFLRPGPPAAERTASTESSWYTCSMHPHIRQPEPGQCPICAMDLIAVDNLEPEHGQESTVTLSPHAVKLAEIVAVPVERKFVTAEIRMAGKVDFDEPGLHWVSTRVDGRLDRLYVDYVGVPVNAGDHLADLYSPQLLQGQGELLSAIASAAEPDSTGYARANVDSAQEKLRRWGLSDTQIQAIENRGRPTDHVTLLSPISGVVVQKQAVEGMYVKTGTQIYLVADLSKVWVKFDAYESDLAWLRYGQTVSFRTDAYPGKKFQGPITFIDPVLDPLTRTVKVRVILDNPDGLLKPDMFVHGVVESRVAGEGKVLAAELTGKWISPMHPEIVKDHPGKCDVCGMALQKAETLGYTEEQEEQAPLVIPATAPLITGKRAVVYVAQGTGRYEGRQITLGPRAGDHYLVRSGLEEGERVVVRGNFKIDSALQILAKPSMMNQPEARTPEFDVPELRIRLGQLAEEYYELQQALSQDQHEPDPERAARWRTILEADLAAEPDAPAQELWRGLTDRITRNSAELSATGEIEEARTAFAALSEALIEAVRRFGADSERPIYLLNCPMAFDGQGSHWLQAERPVANPYYGRRMFRCGQVEDNLAELRPSHE